MDGRSNGACLDDQAWNESNLNLCIEDSIAGLPALEPVPCDTKTMAFFKIGEDAFALKDTMMKPFNYR